jgi:hypothetical protein
MGLLHSFFGLAINLTSIAFVTITAAFLAHYVSKEFNLADQLVTVYIVCWCFIMGLMLYLIKNIRREIASSKNKKRFKALKEAVQQEKAYKGYE